MAEDQGLIRRGVAPLHQQLAEVLRDKIAQMPSGDPLPTELELVATFGVSRSTVRKALQGLVDDGLLVRRQGKGTFVAPQRLVHPLDRLRPFISIFTAVGKHPDGILLDYQWISEAARLPQQLTANSDGALLVRRLYRLDTTPQALAEIFIPHPFGRAISRAAIEEHPIYQVLEDELGIIPDHAAVVIRSQGATTEQAAVLEVAVGSPLLVMERSTHDREARIVECARYYLPSDSFEIRLSVKARELQPVSYSFARPGVDLVLVPGQ